MSYFKVCIFGWDQDIWWYMMGLNGFEFWMYLVMMRDAMADSSGCGAQRRGEGFLLVAVSMSPCAERRWRRFGLDWFGFWISSRRISMSPLLLRAERAWQKIWPPPSHCIHFTFSANFARTDTGKPIWPASFSDHIFQFICSCLGFPAWIASAVKG